MLSVASFFPARGYYCLATLTVSCSIDHWSFKFSRLLNGVKIFWYPLKLPDLNAKYCCSELMKNKMNFWSCLNGVIRVRKSRVKCKLCICQSEGSKGMDSFSRGPRSQGSKSFKKIEEITWKILCDYINTINAWTSCLFFGFFTSK